MAIVLVGVAAALASASSVAAYTRHATLNEVASLFAQRPVVAKCYAIDEEGSPDSFGAWGYVEKPLGKQRFLHLDELVCAGALGINDVDVPAWQRALGVLVLTHESYHLRRWGAAGSEPKVECKAIRHWRVAARLLGASGETLEALWPYALSAHYELTNFTGLWDAGERPYFDPGCVVPPLRPEL